MIALHHGDPGRAWRHAYTDEDECSGLHRWRGVFCLFQGTLALMTWLIACPGSAAPLINQAADWIQSFASPAHWWTGKDTRGPGADTNAQRPAGSGPAQASLNVTTTNGRMTGATRHVAAWLQKKKQKKKNNDSRCARRKVSIFLAWRMLRHSHETESKY